MKFLTPNEIKDYATTPKKALEISIKAWWQKCQATEKSFRYIKIGWRGCGLCWFHFISEEEFEETKLDCKKCVLGKSRDKCSNSPSTWIKMQDAQINYEGNKTPANWLAWQKAARAMHRKLCSLRSKR